MEINEKIKLSRDIMIISGIFCAFTAILLLLNYLQMSRNEPLESEALKILVERLTADPGNEALKEDIRNLDLLARKAYFTSQWQVKTGAWILITGAIVLSIAIWFNRKWSSRIDKPELFGQPETKIRLITQKWLILAGGIILVSAFIASYLSSDYLEAYKQPVLSNISTTGEEEIEVIRITRYEPLLPDIAGSEEEVVNVEESEKTEKGKTEKVSTPLLVSMGKAVTVELSEEEIYKHHNSFRGAFGHGVSKSTNIPVEWNGSDGKNVIWKTSIPKQGYNSPIIWDDKIFLSGADENVRVVYCLDLKTGKILWEREASDIPGSPAVPPNVTDDTGLAAPTLTVDGSAVYALFGTGDLIAFDHEGTRLWARNLGVPDNHYGHSSSLIVWDKRLYIQYDTNRGGRLLAVNTNTGESVWDVRRNNRISWASPILINVDGRYQIVTSSEPTVAAHNPENGDVIWSLDCMMGEVGPSPAYSDGIVFAANEYAVLTAIKPGENPEILWEENEYLPEASSPVAFNGLLYLATSYGVFVCYDAKTGEKYWEHDSGKGFYSSPVIADDKVYVIDLGGKMYIFKALREKVLLGEPSLGENSYATPAFADGKIFLRGEKNLYCIGVN